MLFNYVKVAFRNLFRSRLYSAINIFGLAIGMAACLMIFLWVQDELSYDRFHQNAENIYRVERKVDFRDIHGQAPITSGPYGAALVQDYPEVENFVRIDRDEISIKDQRNIFRRQSVLFTDNSLLEIFDFRLQRGDPETALTQPKSIILTQDMALRYLGTEDVLGQTLTVDWNGSILDCQVTGILEKVPHNSHVHFDVVVSLATYPEEFLVQWFNNSLYTYVLVREGTLHGEMEEKMTGFMEKYMGAQFTAFVGPDVDINEVFQLKLKPLLDIHLHPSAEFEIEAMGSMTSVLIFTAIALMILLIACLNFMNLSTARANKRAKEVGLRKTVGAGRRQLWGQFLGESILMSFVALIFAVGLILLALPAFNQLTQKALTIGFLFVPGNVWMLLAITLVTGVLAGLYPAFVLTAFQPVKVLKGTALSGTGKSIFRKGMAVLQFSISIMLIVGTLVIFKQMEFVRNKSLGFDHENMLLITTESETVRKDIEVLRSALQENPRILAVGGSSNIPGSNIFSDTVFKRDDSDDIFSLMFMATDYEFIDTYGFQLLQGRLFSREFGADSEGAVVLNRAAVSELGFAPEEIVDKTILMATSETETIPLNVVGVVDDFHFKSLHRVIEPLVLWLVPDRMRIISVRMAPGDLGETLSFVQQKWMEIFPQEEFSYTFLDDRIKLLYQSEGKMRSLFLTFSILSIFVACLGLLGLAAFTAQERTKEIGVRKVLGASVGNILLLLSKEFVKWVLVANILAWPIAYYAMNRWMQNFAYRSAIGVWPFVLSAILAMFVALFTVGFQALKAALTDPVTSLRYE
jgi:putative ABC transport system permease protein